jgi:hypothetical protein
MADVNEIRALKASFLGTMDAAAALETIRDRVMSIDPRADISDADLAEMGRLTLAHAVAAQALRGLVESMRARRAVKAT